VKKGLTAEYIIKGHEEDISCTISRKRCKNLRIAITPDSKVQITAPLRAADSYINEVVREKTPWIMKTLRKMQGCRILPVPDKFISGEKVAYLGEEYTLKVISGRKATVTIAENLIVIEVKANDPAHVKRTLDAWYRAQAKTVFSKALEQGFNLISHHGLSTPLLNIRSMKSRWGSCSRSGKVTLNLRLIHLPIACIEYIIMHELCHLKHLNHSRAFYLFLEHFMPDWKERKIKLESYRLMHRPDFRRTEN
jgi:predicted metal-dependent hydrolase